MRKVTRKSLDELAKVMPVISEENQKMYVGGTSGYTGTTGYTDTIGTTGITGGTGYYGGDNTDYGGGTYGGGDTGGSSSSTGYYGTTGTTGSTGYNYGGTGSYTDNAYVDSGYSNHSGAGYPPYAGEGLTSNPYIPNNGAPSNGVIDSGTAYTSDNPCPYDEFDRRFASGTWTGGYVVGMGYVGMQIITTQNASSTPMNGTFVTAADILAENNANSKEGIVSDIVEAITGIVSDGTGQILDKINDYWGNTDIAAYFKQNPNGQLYKVEQKLTSNMGVERILIRFYDKDNRLIATIVQ